MSVAFWDLNLSSSTLLLTLVVFGAASERADPLLIYTDCINNGYKFFQKNDELF
jgi:hypothetical protein